MSGPLSGIRVVDVTFNLLGPSATQLLGDMGADVIKVEPPTGDANRHSGPFRSEGMSSLFMTNNRNKRSVTLDLKSQAGREDLFALLANADVFVHSMRASAAARLGIAYSDIEAVNPGIVYAFGAGFDQDGPKKSRPAFDDIIQGECGLVALTQQATGRASYVPTALVDKMVGHQLASAITMALFHRERTGQGQEVYVPMYESMVEFMFVDHLWGGVHQPPTGPLGYSRILKRRPFQTLDGHICVTAINDQQWARLFSTIERPDLAANEKFARLGPRNSNFDELFTIVEAEIRLKSTQEWLDLFEAADLPCGKVMSLQDLYDDPYLHETGFWVDYEHPTEGLCRTTNVTTRFSRSPGAIRLPPPVRGQHNQDILGPLHQRKKRPAETSGTD